MSVPVLDRATTDSGRPRIPRSIVVLTAFTSLMLAAASILRHAVFNSKSFDLAFYVQDVWAIAHGLWTNTVSGFHVLADHFSPILVLLAPLAAGPTAYSLLLLQGVLVGLGVIPAYRLGLRHGGHERGLMAAIWYTASAAIWHAVLFDFHPVTLGVPLLMWLIAETEDGRNARRLLLLGLAAVLIREDIAILAGVVIIVAALRRRHWGLTAGGALVAAAGVGYILWASLFPGGMAGYHLWTRFGASGSGPLDLAAGGLANLIRPDSLVSLTAVLVPFLILPPLRGWRSSWPGLAIVAFNCAVAYGAQASLYYQYFAPALPFLIWGASRSFSKPGPEPSDRLRLARFATVAVFGLLGPIAYLGFGLPDRYLTTSLLSLERMELVGLLGDIPASASVSATDHLLPHLADRRQAYPFPGPMECSQSLIFHVPRTSSTEYAAVEWDAFGPETDLRAILSSWGYKLVRESPTAGVWVLDQPRLPSQTCPTVAEEREQFTRRGPEGS
jgi:hypothetical protein